MSEEEIQDEVVITGEPDAAQAVENEESAPLDNGESVEAKAEVKTEDAPANPNGAQKRIGELTHNWRSTERERDYWRDLAMKEQPQPVVEQNQEATLAPTLESVEFDEAAYQLKMAEWMQGNLNQQLDRKLADRDEAVKSDQAERERQIKRQSFDKNAQSFAANKPDYYDIAHNPELSVSETMADVIASSEKGPEVLYHLGNNPDEAARIAQLPPTYAALEIGRIEARISLPAAKTLSTAPPPIESINGGGESPAADPDKMTVDQWREQRNQDLLAKQGYT